MAKISIKDLVKIVDVLDEIHDPRRTKYSNIRHKLVDIIVIAFTATVCGYEDYEEMEELGRLKQDFFKGFLELPNGIPDESAFRRVLQCLNANELKTGLERWLVDIQEREKAEGAAARLVNIDGKTIRGSGFHVVSAWVGAQGLTLGQLETEAKSNEITAVPGKSIFGVRSSICYAMRKRLKRNKPTYSWFIGAGSVVFAGVTARKIDFPD